jgi:hypothetical protein
MDVFSIKFIGTNEFKSPNEPYSVSYSDGLSSTAHPRTNRQVERANGLVLQGMKVRMHQDLQDKGINLI